MSDTHPSERLVMPENSCRRLDSWKEIADYLRRDRRTALRWEKGKGLPVHRVPGGRHQTVFAFTSEIDEWLAGAVPLETEGPQQTAPTAGARAFFAGIPFPVRVAGIIIPAAILVVFIARGFDRKPLEGVTEVLVRNNKLVALSESGDVCWQHDFSLRRADTEVRGYGSYIGDLNGDGQQEIVANLHFIPQPVNGVRDWGALVCFSAGGQLLWQHTYDETLSFRSIAYGPPWSPQEMLVFGEGSKKRIAWTVRQSTWWPSVLTIWNDRGELQGKYVNSGWIYFMRPVEVPGTGTILLLGGVSNSNNGGMLAVLDPKRITGTSPESPGSEFRCDNCPAGGPMHYFVFPRSELNLATASSYNYVSVSASGDRIYARPVEFKENSFAGDAGCGESIYEFSFNFELMRISYTDSYWDMHRILERAGKIGHGTEECPERTHPRPVRSWDPRNGWSELSVAYLTPSRHN